MTKPDETAVMLERLRPSVLADSACRRVFDAQLRLAASQWRSPEALERHQLASLKRLVRFAAKEVPFWRDRLSIDAIEHAETLGDALAHLPILARTDVRDHRSRLGAENLPENQRPAQPRTSSGSTGMAVTVATTKAALAAQQTQTLRAHLWGARDFSRGLAVIRRFKSGLALYPDGDERDRWGPKSTYPFATGPSFYLTTHGVEVDRMWEWLTRKRPAYLLTYPSIVRALAEMAAREGRAPAPLQGISTVAELVDDELRTTAAEHLAPIHDIYSAEEVGAIALQCPSANAYHVPSETIIVEVVDDEGRACSTGETGRVLVTPLFNYAMPLLRYELGDFAVKGEACACGRGLPVLQKIAGRRRNMLVLADGRKFWPSLGARFMQRVVPIIEHQFRQTAPNVIEVWLVTDTTFSTEQENEIRKIIAGSLPAPFDVRIQRVPAIPRPASGKHEEFISLIGVN